MTTGDVTPYYVGQRLSLKGQSCTVRYLGQVAGKPKDWLGVEWDDPNRGKHDGAFEGTRYFECRSKSSTAASFLKPTQSWDHPRSFVAALKEKYMDDFQQNEAEVVYISGKQAEEIGFQKFAQRQSRLHGIRVLVLDHMRIKSCRTTMLDANDKLFVETMCTDITELDLSGNLFEGFEEVLHLCTLMPKLRTLTLDANRFGGRVLLPDAANDSLPRVTTIKTLNLSYTLLSDLELEHILSFFPGLQSLALSGNEIVEPLRFRLAPSLSTLDLSNNRLTSMSDLQNLGSTCPPTIILKHNAIRTLCTGNSEDFQLPVSELDLTYNQIDSWEFFDGISPRLFPKLYHLRVTGNPLYRNLKSAEGKALTPEDGYMLTIARLPQVSFLNYAKITDKERLNAETYYLNQIGIEISRAAEGEEKAIVARHPRYQDLCREYGEPNIQRRAKEEIVDQNSLAAQLVTVNFALTPNPPSNTHARNWTEELPKSVSVYSLLGIIGKGLGIMPLHLRLVLETNESDPVRQNLGYSGPEWWDSSDDEGDDLGAEWVKRETELVPGTRAIGTYVEGREASVRVEIRDGDS